MSQTIIFVFFDNNFTLHRETDEIRQILRNWLAMVVLHFGHDVWHLVSLGQILAVEHSGLLVNMLGTWLHTTPLSFSLYTAPHTSAATCQVAT